MRSITSWPKPLRVGGLTSGPPDSIQLKRNSLLSSTRHLTFTAPTPFDQAPYLTQFVANSFKAIPIASVASGLREISGPSQTSRAAFGAKASN